LSPSAKWSTAAEAAIAIAFAAGGALKIVTTTPLLSAEEGVEAIKKAATCGYRPGTDAAGARGA
jgi:hypothetical protein